MDKQREGIHRLSELEKLHLGCCLTRHHRRTLTWRIPESKPVKGDNAYSDDAICSQSQVLLRQWKVSSMNDILPVPTS